MMPASLAADHGGERHEVQVQCTADVEVDVVFAELWDLNRANASRPTLPPTPQSTRARCIDRLGPGRTVLLPPCGSTCVVVGDVATGPKRILGPVLECLTTHAFALGGIVAAHHDNPGSTRLRNSKTDRMPRCWRLRLSRQLWFLRVRFPSADHDSSSEEKTPTFAYIHTMRSAIDHLTTRFDGDVVA